MTDEEKMKQWCEEMAGLIDKTEREIQNEVNPLYDAINLSNKYYEEIISSIGEPQNEEVIKVASEIANNLAVLSIKYNCRFCSSSRKLND